MSGREYAMLFGFGGCLMALLVFLANAHKQATSLRTHRFDALMAALRDPATNPVTRDELLRALVRDHHGSLGFLWQRLRNPATWRTLWFSIGWLLFIVGGSFFAFGALGVIDGVDRSSVLPVGVLGFAMLTLPLALRELTRRDRRAAET